MYAISAKLADNKGTLRGNSDAASITEAVKTLEAVTAKNGHTIDKLSVGVLRAKGGFKLAEPRKPKAK